MNHPEVIGIDLGGTTINFGRFLENGTCLESLTIPTPQPSNPESVIKAIATIVNELNHNKKCVALGLGTPGPTNADGRIAKVAINLDGGWKDVPVANELEIATGVKTILANDGNCAALGEAWLGAGKHFNNLILLTLGTGVGGAIILDRKLFRGHNGAAGELGLITLNPNGPPCNSGNKGSLEQYVSATAIRRQTGKEPLELGKLAENNDHDALTFWHNYGKNLGAGLASLVYVLAPEAILIGGGVSGSAEYFFSSAMAEIESRVLESSRIGLKLLKTELGSRAGVVGAAKLAWDLFNK